VGKITPKGETELSAEERLLRAIFGEKARECATRACACRTGSASWSTSGSSLATTRTSSALHHEMVRVYIAQSERSRPATRWRAPRKQGAGQPDLPAEDMPICQTELPSTSCSTRSACRAG